MYCVCVLEFVTREDARNTLESELGDWGPGRFARGKFYKIPTLLWNFSIYDNMNY